jgi:hypothetical protein
MLLIAILLPMNDSNEEKRQSAAVVPAPTTAPSEPPTTGLTDSSSSTPTPPTIESVSTVGATQTQTITIVGRGFGSTPGSDGNLPCFEIADLTKGWNAGHIDPASSPAETGAACSAAQGPQGDAVTAQISSWTDTGIVITAFDGMYGSTEYGWYFSAGDQVAVRIWNAQSGAGPASFTTTVVA